MEFINKEGEKKPFSEISGKPFGLYFSAHWVGAFNPQMFMMHDSLHSRGFKMPAVCGLVLLGCPHCIKNHAYIQN